MNIKKVLDFQIPKYKHMLESMYASKLGWEWKFLLLSVFFFIPTFHADIRWMSWHGPSQFVVEVIVLLDMLGDYVL